MQKSEPWNPTEEEFRQRVAELPKADPSPEEIRAIKRGRREHARSEYVELDELLKNEVEGNGRKSRRKTPEKATA